MSNANTTLPSTPSSHSETAPEATTVSGRVRGFWRGNSAAFLGIPFAAPPVGALRFLAPAPVEPWSGVREATEYGATPQRRPFGVDTTIPEPSIPGDNTLNVNVFTPAPGDVDAGLPVYVWIHGGGFFAGSPASDWYDGRSFNRDGVVTVSVSYRLGFDGFGWIDGAPLNRGVLDQIFALEWVRDNIRAFGGDPTRVTIGGQSAGGGSVLTLLSSPRAEGLFCGAISHSGAIGSLDAEGAELIGRAFADALGIAPDLDSWRTVSEDQILDRQGEFNSVPGSLMSPSATLAQLAASVVAQHTDGSGLAFAPVIDGDVVVSLDVAIRSGRNADVSLLLGATANEFAYPTPDSLDDVAASLVTAGVDAAAVAGFTTAVAELGAPLARSQVMSAGMFRVPAITNARLRATSRAGISSGAGERTWLYDFQFHTPVNGLAGHCVDLPFAWDLLDAPQVTTSVGENLPQALADTMHAAWVRFMSTGTVDWPAVGRAEATSTSLADALPTGAMRFDTESHFEPDSFAFERAILEAGSSR